MQIDVLGIDLAKSVFQLHGVTSSGAAVHRSKVSRPSLLLTIERLGPRMVVMEACASAHHWARQLLARGIAVKLISPQFVAPFVKTNKNDRNDAEGIVEAASRPAMRFVAVKSVEQQDIQSLHRSRELYVHQRTAVINHVRGARGQGSPTGANGLGIARRETKLPSTLARSREASARQACTSPAWHWPKGCPVSRRGVPAPG